MGMSSSQARLLSLTARMHDIEYKAQRIEAQKLQMANESKRVYEDYLNALDMNKFVAKSMTSNGSLCDIPFTANTIYSYGQFSEQLALTAPNGQIYVPRGFDTNYKNTEDLQGFLNNYVETGAVPREVHTPYDNPEYLDAVERYNQALEAAPNQYAIAHGEWEDRNASEIERLHNLYLDDYAGWEYDRDHFQESDIYQSWLDRYNANEEAHEEWETKQTQWNDFNDINTENALNSMIEYKSDGTIDYNDNGTLKYKGDFTDAQKNAIKELVDWATTYPATDIAESNLPGAIDSTIASEGKTQAQTLNEDETSIYYNSIKDQSDNIYQNLYKTYLGSSYNSATNPNTTSPEGYKAALTYIIDYDLYYDAEADEKCTQAAAEFDIQSQSENNIFYDDNTDSSSRPRGWSWLSYCYVDENGNNKHDDNEMIYVDQNGDGDLDANELYIYYDSDNNDTYNLDKNENDPTRDINELFKEEDFVFLDTDNDGNISDEEKVQQIKNAKLAAYIRFCNNTSTNSTLNKFMAREPFAGGYVERETSTGSKVKFLLSDYIDFSYSYVSTLTTAGKNLDYNHDISKDSDNNQVTMTFKDQNGNDVEINNLIGKTSSDHTLVMHNATQTYRQGQRIDLAVLSSKVDETTIYAPELSEEEKAGYSSKSNYEILSKAYDKNGNIKRLKQWAIDLYSLYRKWEDTMTEEYNNLVASGNTPTYQGNEITTASDYIKYGNCLDNEVEIEGKNITFRNLQNCLESFYKAMGKIDIEFIPEAYEENKSIAKSKIDFPFEEPTFDESAPEFNVAPPQETDPKYIYTTPDEPKLEDFMPDWNDYFYKDGEIIPEKLIDITTESFTSFTDPEKAQWYANLWAKMNGMEECPKVESDIIHDDATNTDTKIYFIQNIEKVDTTYSTNPVTGYEQSENYIVIPDEMMNNNEWIYNVVSGAFGLIQRLDNKQNKFIDTAPAVMTEISEVPNEVLLKKAEAKYEADMKKIDLKDRKYDTDLAALENERNAIKQEIETLKTVAKDNVERTFKLFG